mgnify:CR=1 FL=1
MTRLSELVHVARRFQRSIKIDTDLQSEDALTGFICPQSSADVLIAMANHIKEGQQAAFTWTGPYGSGKSSLVVALSALTSGDKHKRAEAAQAVGKRAAAAIQKTFPPGNSGWKILPVIGQRSSVSQIIGEALIANGFNKIPPKNGWNDQNALAALNAITDKAAENTGLIVFIDEMGKFLEAAANDRTDLYFFQLLAEAAARSQGKLVIVGILHQAFEEYSNRLTRLARDEWTKIQGRYIDLAVNTAGEEQIDLLARAIQSSNDFPPIEAAKIVAKTIQSNIPNASSSLATTLAATWPLHPIVAALLGPISRRRFGQNQRSLFSFLNSAEPYGFQDFIHAATIHDLYTPDRLWDYLRINLEPSIMASPDGHKWATAAEAIDRCEASKSSINHIKLLKTIALIDLFKDRAGLYASPEILSTITVDSYTRSIQDLLTQSLIIYRKHLGAYSLYSGSDFDIEAAIENVLKETQELDFQRLQSMASIHPALAKKHYFKTGTLRWVDVKLVPTTAAMEEANKFNLQSGSIGLFLLVLPIQAESELETELLCKEISQVASKKNVIVGYPEKAWAITSLSRELSALEKIRTERPELSGDKIARREVESRKILVQNELESELQQAISKSKWFRNGQKLKENNLKRFNNIASDIADSIYSETPVIHNELLNRHKPSSSAVAAQNVLLKAMVTNESKARLGIVGYPAEGGLYETILSRTGLHDQDEENSANYKFKQPSLYNHCNLIRAWEAANQYIQDNTKRNVGLDEISNLWEEKPFGIKRGLMPILITAYILSIKNNIAIYREDIFQPEFTDLDTDYLARDLKSIQIRWVDLSQMSKHLLSGLSKTVTSLSGMPVIELEPLEVARGIISIFDKLPNWTKRTQNISNQAKAIRNVLKNSYDPNQLLFTDIPSLANIENIEAEEATKKIIRLTDKTLTELTEHYSQALQSLESLMLSELNIKKTDTEAYQTIKERAEAIKQLSGDFRVNAFINRLVNYDGSIAQIEGLGSLAANKPPRDWVDTDLDRARIEIVAFTESFKRTENYSRIKGKLKRGSSVSIMLGVKSESEPLFADIHIGTSDSSVVDSLAKSLQAVLNDTYEDNDDIALAALSKVSATLIRKMKDSPNKKKDT